MDGVNPSNRSGAATKPASRIPDVAVAEPAPTMGRDGYVSKAKPAPVQAAKQPSTLQKIAKVMGPVGFAAGLVCVGMALFGGAGLSIGVIGACGAVSCLMTMLNG